MFGTVVAYKCLQSKRRWRPPHTPIISIIIALRSSAETYIGIYLTAFTYICMYMYARRLYGMALIDLASNALLKCPQTNSRLTDKINRFFKQYNIFFKWFLANENCVRRISQKISRHVKALAHCCPPLWHSVGSRFYQRRQKDRSKKQHW